MPIHSFGLLSNHYHLPVEPESARHQALFAGYFSGNLAREIGRLHDWSGKVWSCRYAAVPVTDEPEAQIARLKYVLAPGVKEGLVEKVQDWPGATGLPAARSDLRACRHLVRPDGGLSSGPAGQRAAA